MRIQHLDKNIKMNLLEDLLKRSPNNYGKYEQGVAEILDHVRSEKMRLYLHIQKNLTEQRLMHRILK